MILRHAPCACCDRTSPLLDDNIYCHQCKKSPEYRAKIYKNQTQNKQWAISIVLFILMIAMTMIGLRK